MMHYCGSLTVHQFPCLTDNYGFLVRDEASGQVASVDSPDGAVIAEAAERLGWGIDLVLNTHWHPDHTGGNALLAERFGARVIAPSEEAEKIAHKDALISGGMTVTLGATSFAVFDVPGHTAGHIAFYAEDAKAAFVGDTLFSLGCGRMFEGTPAQFWESLLKLKALPSDTMIFCAHEYTASNAAFALSIDGENEVLAARARAVTQLREADQPTVPVILADELVANPFLRADDPNLAARVGKPGAPHHEVFAEIRRRKDAF
ncbi:MAG: hydroxyacylglutathione hydrolase [Pseudomonadota bacterium]